jgi:DNA-binding beta-propeller fold protein YncE
MTEPTTPRADRSTDRRPTKTRKDTTATRFSRRDVVSATAGAVGLAGLAGFATVASAGEPESSSRDVMITCNAADGSVSILDADAYEHLRTVQVYPDDGDDDVLEDALIDRYEPEILNAFARENYLEHANLSPDGRTLYAARGHVGDVVAVDVETGEQRWETELPGFRADHQILSNDGRYVFTSDLVTSKVLKIDAETGRIVDGEFVPQHPHGLHYHRIPAFGGDEMVINGSLGNMVLPDHETGDPFPHRLTFVDPETMRTCRTVAFEEGVRPIAITEDGRKAYVQISYFHGFHEYDIDADEVTRTVELPTTEHVPEDEGDYPLQSAHHGIALSGDDEYVCAAATTSWYVAILRRSDLEVVGTVDVGEHPYWVKTTRDGDHAFVPVRGENEMSVINYEDAEEVARIPVGDGPHVTERGSIPEEIL